MLYIEGHTIGLQRGGEGYVTIYICPFGLPIDHCKKLALELELHLGISRKYIVVNKYICDMLKGAMADTKPPLQTCKGG